MWEFEIPNFVVRLVETVLYKSGHGISPGLRTYRARGCPGVQDRDEYYARCWDTVPGLARKLVYRTFHIYQRDDDGDSNFQRNCAAVARRDTGDTPSHTEVGDTGNTVPRAPD